jgi:hypothetical protein
MPLASLAKDRNEHRSVYDHQSDRDASLVIADNLVWRASVKDRQGGHSLTNCCQLVAQIPCSRSSLNTRQPLPQRNDNGLRQRLACASRELTSESMGVRMPDAQGHGWLYPIEVGHTALSKAWLLFTGRQHREKSRDDPRESAYHC